ncbi:MAG: cysteine desulfurase [Gemmatales bacterium]|nr:MAG: cysteine desulfurase [Gemmatales bacterium]
MNVPISPLANARETDASFPVEVYRRDFPILAKTVNGNPLVYLDSAATSQKPRTVLETIERYYTEFNANVHRGVHWLSEQATRLYEDARGKLQRFIGAAEAREIIFVRGATEAINLVAQSFGRTRLQPGDDIIVSHMEHHSNIVPWQILCEQTGANLRVIPIDDAGELQIDAFERMLSPRTKIVAIVHVSNSLGTVNPVERIIRSAHREGARVVLDAAQSVPHMPIDVQSLDCDFCVFSGHKMYGPTGIGVLYGKAEWLEAMPPYQGGGDMIRSVTFEKTTYNTLPYKFEAGTPHIAGAIGLGAAVDYLNSIGMESIRRHEQELLSYAHSRLQTVGNVKIIGNAAKKAAVISFVLDDVHPHDVGTILDQQGIAVRTGHHCCQPVMDRYGIPATVRMSLGLYNNTEDIDALVRGLEVVRQVFGIANV